MDRRARGMAVSFLVRRKLAEASCSHQRAADVLGISRQRFEAVLDDGTIQSDDIPILEPVAPGLMAAWAARKHLRVVPERESGTATEAAASRHKPALSLLPWAALPEVAEVMAFGAGKHTAHGWRDGTHSQVEYLDKALRHLAAHLGGVQLDAESGKRHLAHAAADLLIALELG